MPWSLFLTALLLVLLWAVITRHSRKREVVQRSQMAVVESSLAALTHSIQSRHQKKFGRANTDLAGIESSLPDRRGD